MRSPAAIAVVGRAVVIQYAVNFLAVIGRDTREGEGLGDFGERSESHGIGQERAEEACIDKDSGLFQVHTPGREQRNLAVPL